MKRFIKQRYRQWLDQRIPASREVTLDQRRIFIFPSRYGWFYTVVLLSVLLAAINYENNLAFALAFLLVSLFVVAILHTYSNLSGLTIRAGRTKAAFAGEDAEFDVILRRQGKREYHGVHLCWPNSAEVVEDVCRVYERKTKLFLTTKKRGWMRAERLLLESHYPLGILRAWSWIDLDMTCLVYPKPIFAGRLPHALSRRNEGVMAEQLGAEDFYGFRDYVAGDPLKHVSWKSMAKGQALLTKQFAANVDRRVWLDWYCFSGDDEETRLSKLCYWTLELSKGQDEYGLRLPEFEIKPDTGEVHRDAILRALALFGNEPLQGANGVKVNQVRQA